MKNKLPLVLSALAAWLALSAQAQPRLLYWFDNLPATSVSLSTPEDSFEFDASFLKPGVHSLSVAAEGESGLSSPFTTYFVKLFNPAFSTGNHSLVIIDGEPRPGVPVSFSGNTTSFMVDASDLKVGLHSLATATVSTEGDMTNIVSTYFLRMPLETELATTEAFYFIDNDLTNIHSIPMQRNMSGFFLDIDVSTLTTGLHSITAYLASPLGFSTTPRTSYFVKIPLGGEGLARYEYWIDESHDKTVVELDERALPFSLVKMIEVPTAPFRSSNFEVKMEPDGIAAYGVHNFNFIGLDADYRAVNASHEYVESRIRKTVTNITELSSKQGNPTTGKVSENDIKWYSLNMQTGDSLALRTGTVADIDVFNPKGERCYRVSGSESTAVGGFHAFEDGQYLVAVHDVSNAAGSTNLQYHHIDKFDIIATGPKSTAEADMFALNLTGNGINQLKRAKLSCGGTEIESNRVVATDSGHGYCLFDLTDAPQDVYALIAEFDDGAEVASVEVAGALRVVEPRPGEIKVSAARSVFGTTLNDVLITVSNTGNVPYWGLPFNLAAEADGTESIKLNFKDFIPYLPGEEMEARTVILTDNLLGTGRRGGYLPMMIPYLGPNETREFTIVYQMPLTVHIPTYTWTGRPWSEEFKELKAMVNEGNYPEIKNLNYISASTFSLAMAVIEHNASLEGNTPNSGQMRAPAQPVDISGINNAVDLANNVGNLTGQNLSALNNANTVAQQSVGIGNTLGGLINGARLSGLDATAAAAGIDLSTGQYSSLENYRNDLQQSLPDPRRIANDSWGAAAALAVDAMLGNGGCATTASPMPTAADIVQMTPCDPNDIIGYQDPSGGRYVGVNVKTIPYTIEFENDPELATAPAHVIKVADRLDPKVFDLSTFRMREIKIGRKSLELKDSTDFVVTIDMRPEINSVAEISFELDRTTGNAEWTIRSLDRMTMETATEMIYGVLPVNYDGIEGTGEILFDIDLKSDLKSGTTFSNQASIIFDSNDAIETPVWDNETDYDLPEARITSVEYNGAEYTFEVEASDKGSGIWSYELWHLPAGQSEWEILKGGIPEDEVVYESAERLIGTFCVVAIDKAGNRQMMTPMTALLGDANNDGTIDATDVVVIQNYFTNAATRISKIQSDVNVDYSIDAQDAVLISNRFIFGDNKKHIRTRKNKRK